MNGCESVDDLPIRVLGIGGSTRRDSKSLVLLQSALHLAADAGAEVTLADVRALDLPIYDHDRPLQDYPSSLHELLSRPAPPTPTSCARRPTTARSAGR